jgi:DNA-binding NarL/FixJ family response regulator
LNKSPISILITSSSPRRCDSLKAILSAEESLEVVATAPDISSTLDLVMAYHPDLFLLDCALENNTLNALLNQIKTLHSKTCCIVLVNTCHQLEEAKSLGADASLLRGFRPSELLCMIPTYDG